MNIGLLKVNNGFTVTITPGQSAYYNANGTPKRPAPKPMTLVAKDVKDLQELLIKVAKKVNKDKPASIDDLDF